MEAIPSLRASVAYMDCGNYNLQVILGFGFLLILGIFGGFCYEMVLNLLISGGLYCGFLLSAADVCR